MLFDSKSGNNKDYGGGDDVLINSLDNATKFKDDYIRVRKASRPAASFWLVILILNTQRTSFTQSGHYFIVLQYLFYYFIYLTKLKYIKLFKISKSFYENVLKL